MLGHNDNHLSITPINNPVNNSNIQDQLNSIFRPIRPENSSIAPIFNPTEATGSYFSRTTNTRGRGKRRFNDILNFTATVFCFTEAGESLKIPKSKGPKHGEMVLDGYIKEITFMETNLELIDTKIESEFEILRNKNWIAYRPSGLNLFPVKRNYTIPIIILYMSSKLLN
ncbi:hypothetical protein Glove_173g31 [Diversispora epigaea]|uniref:Uncharacterized protein n=1 Tax=Diversispora epigaea TaxID=1348612 RepID=A0A397IP30_9GLOM|nr:hypothetical protein Glove_173g31 [Diversispora epigaea]